MQAGFTPVLHVHVIRLYLEVKQCQKRCFLYVGAGEAARAEAGQRASVGARASACGAP